MLRFARSHLYSDAHDGVHASRGSKATAHKELILIVQARRAWDYKFVASFSAIDVPSKEDPFLSSYLILASQLNIPSSLHSQVFSVHRQGLNECHSAILSLTR